MSSRQVTVAVDLSVDVFAYPVTIPELVRKALRVGFAKLAVDDVISVDSATVISEQEAKS